MGISIGTKYVTAPLPNLGVSGRQPHGDRQSSRNRCLIRPGPRKSRHGRVSLPVRTTSLFGHQAHPLALDTLKIPAVAGRKTQLQAAAKPVAHVVVRTRQRALTAGAVQLCVSPGGEVGHQTSVHEPERARRHVGLVLHHCHYSVVQRPFGPDGT